MLWLFWSCFHEAHMRADIQRSRTRERAGSSPLGSLYRVRSFRRVSWEKMPTRNRLSESNDVVLMGQGVGCIAISEIVKCRDVKSRVKAVVQICGLQRPPAMPLHENVPGLRSWYGKVSLSTIRGREAYQPDSVKGLDGLVSFDARAGGRRPEASTQIWQS